MIEFLSESSTIGQSKIEEQENEFFNPLAQPVSGWYEFHKRINLFPWWIKYNLGSSKESQLKNNIIQVGKNLGLTTVWMNKIIRHAISEFSKKGLGLDYYGYHNILHELEATYFTLLAASDKNKVNKFDLNDIKYLFLSSLFHDFDPSKRFDKPNEEEVEWFIRKDKKIINWVQEEGLNVDIMIALIYRTAYPFIGEIAKNATEKINELLSKAGISEDEKRKKHYYDLGWFLSVSERVSGYALGNFDRAMELARLNAHGLGWHPSIINKESVKYFDLLNGEKEMLDKVLNSVSLEYKNNFLDNVAKFNDAWIKEIEIKKSLSKNEVCLISVIEESSNIKKDPQTFNSIISIRNDLSGSLLPTDRRDFSKSITHHNTILITLRLKEDANKIVGFIKAGPLEDYQLRRGTIDVNLGMRNTIFIESIYIKSGYWGEKGGHLLRRKLLDQSKKRGYQYVTGYVHRDVLQRRNDRGEMHETVQKYDPDKLDYYRVDLSKYNTSDLSI